MASYMDMVTVLMCLFIVLFAMSSLDKAKFEQLKESLASGFGIVLPEETPGPGTEPSGAPEPTLTDLDRARQEVEALIALRDRIAAGLDDRGLGGAVEFRLDERGLTIRLVGSETFFAPNSTELTGRTEAVLDAVAPVLRPTKYQISVEGHADFHGSPYPFPTVWELSSGRATQVLRHLVEEGGIAPQRIGAVGYGSARPATTGSSEEDMALNRRVDIAVLSNKPESIRALIPEVLRRLGDLAR